MDKIFCIALILVWNSSFSQTKEQLIDSIISANIVESDCVGAACQPGDQYLNFKKLKNELSESEFERLLSHQNPILRTYALIESIESDNPEIVKLFESEIRRNESVRTFEGCIISRDEIQSIVYHAYWNKVRIDALKDLKSSNDDDRNLTMQNAISKDERMELLDRIVIYSDKEIFWHLYSRAFNNRKYKESDLKQIEKLAFEKNISFAYEYLKRFYPEKYEKRFTSYLKEDFPKANFHNSNDIFYMRYFIKELLDRNQSEMNNIAIKKLNDTEFWKQERYYYTSLLKDHGIEL